MSLLIGLWHRLTISLLWVYLSLPPKRGSKARPQTVFHFTVQKRPMSGSLSGPSGISLAKRPHFKCGNEAYPGGKKSADGSVSMSSAEARRQGLLQPPCHLHLQLFRLVCFSNFLISGEALHLKGLCLIWFGVTIFSLGLVLP